MGEENRQFSIVYKSSIYKLENINSSFDRGILRVAYAGKNRNKSCIDKETFEKCINSIYNCPIVCNYNRETNSIGSHDSEIVSDGNGMRIVSLTQPVGVVPESANYWWENVEEDNGEVHEYLCVDVLIWKRQEAYQKIKENKITDESMEIKVKSGETIDGYYHIDSFEFTAFCLLESAEPCYESACIETFSLNEFKNQYFQMMTDCKKYFVTVNPSVEDGIHLQNLSKGGKYPLEKIEDLLVKYGLNEEDLDFNINDFTIDELENKFAEIKKAKARNEDGGNSKDVSGTYSLTAEQLQDQITETLSSVKYYDPYWEEEVSRYVYVDYDFEAREVYCYDCTDQGLYGFNYSMNGDNVIIDFECKKKKKFSIVDFDEGDSNAQNECFLSKFSKELLSVGEKKFNESLTTIEKMKSEIEDLRNYKNEKLAEERNALETDLFNRFSELNGIEAFESLRNNCSGMTLDEIENKCFEIKGRNATFSLSDSKPQSTRIAIEKDKLSEDEPYGGLFIKYSSDRTN